MKTRLASGLRPEYAHSSSTERRKFPAHLRRAVAALALLTTAAPALSQSEADTATTLQLLREELRRLREEIETLKRERRGEPPATGVAAPAANGTVAPPSPASATSTSSSPATLTARAAESVPTARLFGYGEMTFTRPRRDASATEATVRRGVLGWAYAFNERTRFAAELEIENAVSSASDKGEVAFEQFYIEHDLNERVSGKAGLFLLPVGYLNEVHEPTRYYGVHRNFVETAIIPTTWRELGFGLRGTVADGLRLDGGLVTSFDLNKWDSSSEEGRESPLGSIHQEGSLAKARMRRAPPPTRVA